MKLAPLIAALVRAGEAQALLDAGGLPESCAVVSLPVWLWKPADPKFVGRKAALDADGSPTLLPVRADWDPGVLVVVTDDACDAGASTVNLVGGESEIPAACTCVGPGHLSSRTVRIVSGGPDQVAGVDDATAVRDVPDEIAVALGAAAAVEAALRAFVEAGRMARWSLLTELEGMVRPAVYRAHSSARTELGAILGAGQRYLLDETTLEQIRTELTYGAVGDEGASKMMRLIDKCLDPHRFHRVDPLRYIARTVKRDAGEAVRRRIGDPVIGRKVRSVMAAAAESDGAEEILAAYRDKFPADRLSYSRLARALSVGADPMANTIAFDYASDGHERKFLP